MRALVFGFAAALLLAACAGKTETTVQAAPAQTCGAHAPGLVERTIQSGGRERAFKLYVPARYDGTPAPLVFDLHGSGGSPDGQMRTSGSMAAADARGFLVIAPAGVSPRPDGQTGVTWNVPQRVGGVDDVAFIDDVIAAAAKEVCIDRARIYAMGFSGGARFASELACRRPDVFAAVSTVGGVRHPEGEEGACPADDAAAPAAIIAFHGDADPTNTYMRNAATNAPYWTYGVEEALLRWSTGLDCGAPATESIAASVTRRAYPDCRADLVFYRTAGGAHVWPGSEYDQGQGGVAATALSLDFFAAHPRRAH